MAKIQLSSNDLITQSTEMAVLKTEYENLFKETNGLLNTINHNWSARLAHNFSGKILSAQKSFDKITEMLGEGAVLAKKSAETFQSMDELLAKSTFQSQDSVFQAAKSSGLVDIIKKEVAGEGSRPNLLEFLWNQAKEDYKHAGEGIDYFKDLINSNLTDFEKQKLSGILKNLVGEERYEVTNIVLNIISGDASWKDFSKTLSLMNVPKNDVNVITSGFKEAFKIAFDKDWQGRYEYFEDVAWANGFDHGYARLTAGVGEVVDTLVFGTADMLGGMAVHTVENIPVVGILFNGTLGFDLSDTYDSVAGGIHNAVGNAMVNATQAVYNAEEYVDSVKKAAYQVGKQAVKEAVKEGKEIANEVAKNSKKLAEDIAGGVGRKIGSVTEGAGKALRKLF